MPKTTAQQIIGLEEWNSGPSMIGEGNTGSVTKYSYLGTPVAVKTVKERDGMGMMEKYNMQLAIKREVGILKRLRHPNIVNIIASTDHMIVMELFEGNLGTIKSIEEMAFVARECMRALLYMQAHDECTFHGDIKPDNILVNRDRSGPINRVVLADVGLARECYPQREFLGTPGFMPQPQLGDIINNLTDLFALAVSLMDSYFPQRVHTSYTPGLEDNTFEFVSKLPSNVGNVLSKMLVAYKNNDLHKTRGSQAFFFRSILSEWEIILAINETDTQKPRKIADEEERFLTPVNL